MNMQNKNTVSRRTIIKSAAWSMPVIAAAVATPLAAASGSVKTCLRIIESNFTKKSLKLKVQNTGALTAKNVTLTITYGKEVKVIALGNLLAHVHTPQLEYQIPAGVNRVTLLIAADNVPSIVKVLTR